MNHYDIYGMGNALVDIEFFIPDEILTKLNIKKGLMTLMSETELEVLLSALSHLDHKIECGGSAGNTIITAQAFGATTFYSCKISNDRMGDLYYQGLMQYGVDSNMNDHNRPQGKTGRCVVKITPDAERTLCTHLGISETYSIEEIKETALLQSNFLYIEGYLVASASAKLACLTAKRLADTHGIKTAITLSDPNIIQYFKTELTEVIGFGVDLLFCNEAEALLYSGTSDIDAAIEVLKQQAKTLAITLGARGCLVFDGHTSEFIPSIPVKVLNTVGAGDTFAGAFLYGLSRGYSYTEAGKLANHAAGKVVTQLGPRLSRSACQAILTA